MTNTPNTEEGDWEITPDGLYMATRRFLTKRGYCCANRCRNCPYINWRDRPEWQPVEHQYVLRTHVSPKAIDAAQSLATYHSERSVQEDSLEAERHGAMAAHYAFLLQMWGKE